MHRVHARRRQPPNTERGFERSRLEDQLLAAAYELALPLLRRPLPGGRAGNSRHESTPAEGRQRRAALGGLRA
jgi:hypothetical protein